MLPEFPSPGDGGRHPIGTPDAPGKRSSSLMARSTEMVYVSNAELLALNKMLFDLIATKRGIARQQSAPHVVEPRARKNRSRHVKWQKNILHFIKAIK
ncbi:hypothetical protein O0880_24980 [Janthinobacterium sp. SUN118]|uniref:hypothetical protein n=1 Tax=Janthinobacterium sp. SUN118 TaxID=3004100 RepID=UPI0025B09688|nr:hypothetical protein [Janthinobacterium sp. SUN118]MDN2712678.1 hypothetical protein [Janthinobacterium sp. SUN118]